MNPPSFRYGGLNAKLPRTGGGEGETPRRVGVLHTDGGSPDAHGEAVVRFNPAE